MKSIKEDPRVKQGKNKTNSSPAENSANKGESNRSEERERSRYYKNGEPDIEGPNLNKDSEGADGDTTVNAGIFK